MEQQQEWQPKWGEEVIAQSVDECVEVRGLWLGSFNNTKGETIHLIEQNESINEGWIWHSKSIRPIPPKPKTLLNKVDEWIAKKDFTYVAFEELRTIIDRHEKGGEG